MGRIGRMALCRDRDWIAVGDAEGVTNLLDANTGRVLRKVERPGDSVRGVAFASNKQLVIGHASGQVVAVPLPDGSAQDVLQLKHPIKHLQLSGDGRHIALALDEAGTVEIFAWPSGKLISSIPQNEEVALVRFTASGKELIITGAAHLEVFDVATGKRLGGEFQPGNTYNVVQQFGDGSQILVAEGLNGIALRELPSCRVVRRILGDKRGVTQIAISPDGRNLVSGGNMRELQVWDTQTWEQVLAIEYAYPEDSLYHLGFSRTGNRLFGVFMNEVVVWDAPVVE